MGRGAVNGLGQGLHGDLTTTGAVCISSLPNAAQGGRGVLRLGDKTTPCKKCGKTGVIIDSLPAMKWHGIPTVLDGAEVRCGCPPGSNRLIAPLERSQAPRTAVQSATQPDSTPTTNAQLADSKLAEKAASPFVNSGAATSPADCNHPDQMEELATYIAGEMNRNIKHPAVLQMKDLINYDSNAAARKFQALPWYARLAGPPNFNSIALAKKLEAMAIWTKQVGQNMEWDHKPKLRAMYNGAVRHKQGKYDYFYDIWSNIHYGYVGIAGGLSESVLLDGAGVEQIGSDTKRWFEDSKKNPGPHLTASLFDGLRAFDDIADRVAISIGVKLAKQYSSGGG
jgi:uncharacterized Zn-binding protein involved in type VI secretion